MRLTLSLFVLIALIACGCMPKKPDMSGSYTGQNGAVLTVDKGTFSLKAGTDTIEGDTSVMGDKFWLHPKTLNGRGSEGATLDAINQASTMGVQTDMEVQGSIFEAVTFTVGNVGKTLTVEQKPPFKKSGKQPFYNALGTMTKS